MDESQLDTLRNLDKFAPKFLWLKRKSGKPVLFNFNRCQTYLHQRLEAQLKAVGRVRAVIVKGRQLGCSSYISARYFHKIITKRGYKAFILTHETEATRNLFEMSKRFYEALPEGLCDKADRSSVKELKFLALDSGYGVGTAGNKGVGRSQTIQLLHGSEVAFWENAEDHARGILQAVPNEAGTEVILESTANGIGNYFHSTYKTACTSDSEYQAIFLPWYWDDDYTVHNDGFKPDEEEESLLDIYGDNGLTEAHLSWRRRKIRELSNDYLTGAELFKSEYPMNAEEAFRNPIDNAFIDSRLVIKARMAEIDSDAHVIIGVDPAIGNKDRTAIIRRKGRLVYNPEVFRNHNTMEICGKLRHIIDDEKPVRVYVDCIGIGAGVVDRMREMGYMMVEGVNVARSANEKEKFKNLRAELWNEMREWLMSEADVQIPDSDELHGELCSLGFKYTSSGQLQLESKDDLRARGMPSPDIADALSLTFYAGQYANLNTTEVKIVPVHHRTMFY